MRRLITTACFVGALAAANVASAQNAVVRGQVVDENGQPVPGASVSFIDHDEDQTFETETGHDGRYNIVLRPGTYEILIGKDGYRGARLERRFRRSDGIDMPTIDITSTASMMQAAVDDLNERFAQAAQLAGEGKLDEAQAIFEGLLEERPELVDVHYNLGLLHLRKEEPEKAMASFEKALELRPDHAPSAVQLAGLYEEAGRSDEATALIEKVTAGNPDDAAVQVDAAYVHLRANRPEQAQPFLERALAVEPDNVEVHYLLGTVVARSGEFDRAIELLQRYLELAPEDDRYRSQAETMLPQLEEIRAARQDPESQPE